jgi:hypothetical protein
MNPSLWTGWDWFKLVLCGSIDFFDFTIGRVLFFFPFEEIGYMIMTVLMWGPRGLVTLFEILEPTEFIDGFIPITTGTALWALNHKHSR